MATAQILSPDDVAKLVPPVVAQAQAYSIATNEDYEMAGAFLQLVVDREQQIQEVFGPIVKKAHEAHKEAVAQRDKLLTPLDLAKRAVTAKRATFRAEEERKRQEEERAKATIAKKEAEDRALAEAEALEAQGEKHLADIVLQQAAEAPAPVVVVAPTVPKQEGFAVRKTWKYRIVNEALLPREYLSPDPVKIGAVVRSQKENAKISGVEVYCEEGEAVRGRN